MPIWKVKSNVSSVASPSSKRNIGVRARLRSYAWNVKFVFHIGSYGTSIFYISICSHIICKLLLCTGCKKHIIFMQQSQQALAISVQISHVWGNMQHSDVLYKIHQNLNSDDALNTTMMHFRLSLVYTSKHIKNKRLNNCKAPV